MTSSDFDVIKTGNEQMDEILHGGFPPNSINIIMGQPGTGKTVFTEQMVFSNATDGDRPILYITTLSEPVAKLLVYLQRFSFFDDEKIGTAVHYRDIGPELVEKGLDHLLDVIKEAIHEISPKIIVVDSLKALHDLAGSTQQMRRMLYELTGILTTFETTVFLVGEYSEDNVKQMPEFALADGIVEFMRKSGSSRDERFVRVLKLRGSGYMEGMHGCKISAHGVKIYPRLVTPQIPERYDWLHESLSSGIDGFENLIDSGIRRGSTSIVAGPTGGGKTTFALQYVLEGVRQGEQALYVNFQENPVQLRNTIKSLDAKMPDAGEGGLELLYSSPVELQIDSIIVEIFRLIKEKKFSRVVIDSLNDLAAASKDPQRLHEYIYSLTQHFVVNGVTSIITFETTGGLSESRAELAGKFSNIADNIFLLGINGPPDYDRTICCIKARGVNHDLKPHTMQITSRGVKIN
jgi:circadian clock protein KaiC